MASSSLIIFTAAVFFIQLPLNYISQRAPNFLFKHSTQEITNKYVILFTPASWCFITWLLIHIGLSVFCIYSYNVTKRQGLGGKPLNESPEFLTPALYHWTNFNSVSNVVWLFVWDWDMILPSTILMWTTCISAYICLVIVMKNLWANAAEMARNGLEDEIYGNIKYAQNTIGIYATWTTVAIMRVTGGWMAHALGMDQDTVGCLCCGFLTCWIVLWILIDNGLYEQYTRYLITPNIVMAYTIYGIYQLNYDPQYTTATVQAVNVVLGLLQLVLKLYRLFGKKYDIGIVAEITGVETAKAK